MSASGDHHSDDISEFSHVSPQNKTYTGTGEDIRLKNWEQWLKTWENIQNRISGKLGLRPEQLVMHYGDDLKYVNMEKTLMRYARIPTEFDKYRGKPDFWKLPWALPRKFKYCRNEPDYFAVQTKEDKYIIPALELIGTSDHIRQEKNVLNCARNIYAKWQDSKYRCQQIQKLQPKILNIMPHRPEFEDLVVVGESIRHEKKTDLEATSNSSQAENVSEDVKEDEEIIEHLENQGASKKGRLILKINGEPFTLQTTKDDISRKLRINFEYDVASKEEIVQFMLFENCGSATLRIAWEKLSKFRLFRNYTEETSLQGFYFDKNDLIILPGASLEFPIWFKTKTSGTFSESWKLHTTPKIWNDDTQVVLVLHCYAYFADLKEKVNEIVHYINIQTRNDTIKDILRDIFYDIRYPDTLVEPCHYDEAQLFEMANLINDKPYYLYDKIIVNDLKQIYGILKTEQKTWTFSIRDLNKLAHDKDTHIFLENKKIEIDDYINKMKNSTTENVSLKQKSSVKIKKKEKKAKKPKDKSSKKKTEKSSKSSKSKKSLKQKTSKMSQKSNAEPETTPSEEHKENYIYSNQLELATLVKQLESPVVINSKREKYFTCSKILSAYFTKMCHLLDSLEEQNNYMKRTKYPIFKHQLTPINQLPERMIYEYFEDHYLPKHSIIGRDSSTEANDRPKPKKLRDIPADDIEAIYSSYFNVTLAVKNTDPKIKNKKDKKGKEKKGKEKKKKEETSGSKKGQEKKDKKEKKKEKTPKGKEKAKKGKSNKSNGKIEVDKQDSVPCFDPYEEIFIYKPKYEPEIYVSDSIQNTELPKDIKDHYKYLQYVTVYSCLSEAVDAVVDTIESFDCVVSHATLKEVKNSRDPGGEKKK